MRDDYPERATHGFRSKLWILRAFLDTSSLRGRGGYFSPLHARDCATLIPIPEIDAKRSVFLDPSVVKDECTGKPLEHYMPTDMGWLLHRDPRLDLGFYMDYSWRLSSSLARGDMLAFMAGLARYPEGFWERRRSYREIKKAFRESVRLKRAGIYLVGLLHVREVIGISRSGWDYALRSHPQLSESPHYQRPDDKPIAVVGRGYLVSPPAPLSIPSIKLSGQPPTDLAKALLGIEVAGKMAGGNYRKSRGVEKNLDEIGEVLKERGYELTPADQ